LADYGKHYSKVNPWMARIGERPIGLATHSDWSISRGALLGSEFYNDYLRPLEIEVGYGVTIAAEGSQRFLLSVLHDSVAEKDEALLRLMEMLQPHLARAFRVARRASIGGPTSLHGRMLDALGAAIIYLTDRRSLTYANSMARNWLDVGDPLGIDVQGRLRVTDAVCGELVDHLLSSALSWSRPMVRTTRIRRVGARPLQVLLFRPGRQPAELFFAGSHLVMVLIDPDAPQPLPTSSLASAYGLTSAEQRIVDGLVSGYKLDDLAVRHAVSRETLRTQLRAVFGKVGVRSQAELIGEALRSPASLLSGLSRIAKAVLWPVLTTAMVL
jgi:DNA-binding CsgD family transcriptional regulator